MLIKKFIASATLLLACVASISYGAAPPGLPNFAIARPFSLHDVSSLESSFDVWSTYPPCSDGPAIGQPKLFLVYSQSFENDNAIVAKSAIQSVELLFNQTKGWGKCFSQVVGLAVNITSEDDLYRKDEQATNVLWVNGPNRQFERTARALKDEGIDLFYLMEMDSIPISEYWLDTLVEEIQTQPIDFSILGSKYRGDNWDNFYSTLPSSLVNHINGNAIYNLTNGFFWLLVEQLELEAKSVENSVAFDYRISQILDEAEFGIRPAFPPSFLSAYPLTKVSDAIKDSVEAIRASLLETAVIGNYASTNMVKTYLNDEEVIIHGANLRESWDKNEMGNLSLIVSDWHEGNARHLLADLDQSSHPFAEIVVLTDNTTYSTELANLTNLPVQFVSRYNLSDQLDICTAPISTEWFMKTNSFHRMRKKMELMTESVNGTLKPVVPFINANNESCTFHPSCTREVDFARMIDQDTNETFQTNQFIFHTDSRNDFCDFIASEFSNNTVVSATSYVAFLDKHLPNNESMYLPYYKGEGGFRDLFVRLPGSIVPSPLQFANSSGFTNSSNSSDTCALFTAEDECLASLCEWRENFESCRFSWSNETTSSPSVAPSVAPSFSPSAQSSENPTMTMDPSHDPSMPTESKSPSPTIAPTSKGVRNAPVTAELPTVAPVDAADRQSRGGAGRTNRPVWVEAVTGTILGIAALLFLLMMLKKSSNSESEANGAEITSNPDSGSVNATTMQAVMVGDMDDMDSIQGYSSVSTVSDLYQTYLSETGN
ncbi:unnamed protein product [Cylindrotheca closterium]|uniref:Protein xylosyltransferase n=1 Tax=Cylindrotheca closterium TaxID=2856 RepID=A0AAD2JGU3_9STRA|nr:unnamed protein product [Cylindrotheca closterium]